MSSRPHAVVQMQAQQRPQSARRTPASWAASASAAVRSRTRLRSRGWPSATYTGAWRSASTRRSACARWVGAGRAAAAFAGRLHVLQLRHVALPAASNPCTVAQSNCPAAPTCFAAQGTADRLLAGRKLLLILDLDHTLLNSTRFIEVPPESERGPRGMEWGVTYLGIVSAAAAAAAAAAVGSLQSGVVREELAFLRHSFSLASRRSRLPPPTFTALAAPGEAILRAQLEAQPPDAPMLHHLPHMRMWTKLRPGVRQFLEAARER